MKLRYLIPLLLLVTACSARTLTTVVVDLIPFLPPEARAGGFSGMATSYIPSEAGQPISLNLGSLLEALEGARLQVRANLQNTGNVPINASLEVRIAPLEDSTNIFDGGANTNCGVNDCSLGLVSVPNGIATGASETVEISVPLTETDNPTALALIKKGSFRIGLRLQMNGSINYVMEKVELKVQARLFKLLPQ